LDGTFNGLLQAVKSGEISRKQIDASVRRLLALKAQVGLSVHGNHLVDVNQLQNHVARSSSYALAQEVADHAVTLVRDENRMLPMKRNDKDALLAVMFVGDVHGDDGRELGRQIRARVPNAKIVMVDRHLAPVEAEGIAKLVKHAKRVIAAVYSVPQPGQVGVVQTSAENLKEANAGVILQNILDTAKDKTAVLAMGSPYTIDDFPNIKSYLCAFSSVYVSERAAAKALFGEIAIHGKLPVTLPDVAKRGEGLDRDAVVSAR